MAGKEAYKIWAPAGKKWVDWVRPVPFVAINEYSKGYTLSSVAANRGVFLEATYEDAAIIVDLPGEQSVAAGIVLAKLGYRPIPIYNGTIEQQGARATVDNQSVGVALLLGAGELKSINLDDDAMPAFLLDSNRLHRYKMDASIFDNSWDVYPQDMPSAEYMLDNGVHRVVVVSEEFSKDLKKILYVYQKKNIEIFLTDGYEVPKKITIRKLFCKDKD
ncbi:MAG: hypothetical protein IJB96_06920 [Lachnospira sp.]|nr:hypothetical protein [Lachnospira sp.]